MIRCCAKGEATENERSNLLAALAFLTQAPEPRYDAWWLMGVFKLMRLADTDEAKLLAARLVKRLIEKV